MLDNIISVESISKNFKIIWDIEKVCNYDCSYCFPSRHYYIKNSNYKLKSSHELRMYWDIIHKSINNRIIDIYFSGGEPTLNKNLLDFIIHIKGYKNVNNIGVTSNGSASPAYYIKLLNHIDSLTLSTHNEFFNEKKFFKNVLICAKYAKYAKNKLFHISIMNEKINPRIKLYQEFLSKHNISHNLQNIRYDLFNSIPLQNTPNNKTNFNFNG